jgi:hypothetical protein
MTAIRHPEPDWRPRRQREQLRRQTMVNPRIAAAFVKDVQMSIFGKDEDFCALGPGSVPKVLNSPGIGTLATLSTFKHVGAEPCVGSVVDKGARIERRCRGRALLRGNGAD